ncbi:hypothetical protein DFQ27_004241 [Actinomortierella ambigua]|uniref:Trichothecene 3-O-acetyltransferase-like N-terminal domain-containing protein n=1 Tax=Actinomortierella ambigua TaxID=1343610 RepID=A0A9P6Q6H1_9FUNG|nr:hypothetical protein DFQ27_004241 [Actinomortierella ambigua]
MEFELDIVGQQPLLNLYTQLTLAYPIDNDESALPTIIATLQGGLDRLFKGFPWLAGQVVQFGASESSSGIFKIVPFQEQEQHAALVIKDLRHDPAIPAFASLRDAKFPYSAAILDEGYLAPRRTLPGDPNEPSSRPTLLVQATFIQGGLLLTIVTHHMTMDMVGQGQVMSLLSKACLNEPFTDEELSIGNMPRGQLIPFLDSIDMAAFAHQIAKPAISPSSSASTNNDAPPSPPKCTWAYFSFDAPSLAALKADASQTVPSGFVSTDDALSALIWQATMRARLPRLGSCTTTTTSSLTNTTDNNNNNNNKVTFARAVDVRQLMGLPTTYPGVVQTMAYTTATTAQEVVEQPLGVLAWKLRSSLDGKQLAHQTQGFATLLHEAEDKSQLSLTATMDASKDISFSSWAKVEQCHRLTFGMGLGRPVAVRRPKLPPFESLMYLMPRTVEGEIAAAICLRDEEMDCLKADSELLKYGQYIG